MAIPPVTFAWAVPVLDGWLHADEGLATIFSFEPDFAFRQSEDRMVLPHADIGAGMVFGAALPNDDVTGNDGFTTKFFDAESPAGCVAAVSRGTACFFMGHLVFPFISISWLSISWLRLFSWLPLSF